MDAHIIFINSAEEGLFYDIGRELFKLGSALTYALKTNKKLALLNDNYTTILDIFLKINYKKISMEEYGKLKFKPINTLDFNESDNVCITKIEYTYKYICNEIQELFTNAIFSNAINVKFANEKINEIMNFFTDYEIGNYVCMNITKETFVSNFYEKAYYNHFNGKKVIILVNDINWAIANINFINPRSIYFINNYPYERFINFIILASFNNFIVDKNNYSWWCAYLGNKNKKIVAPFNSFDYYLPTWIKQS